METAIVLILVVLIILVILGAIFIYLKIIVPNQSKTDNLLKQDIDGIRDNISKMQMNLTDSLSEKIDRNQASMMDNVRKQFGESSKLIADVTKSLADLQNTNQQVVNVTDELKTLQNILQNPKQRGVLGEYYLQTVLENTMSPEMFTLQYAFKNGEIVDAAVFLDKGKILPIDSKFSLENYNRLVESKDKSEREKFAKLFKIDLKTRIDETAKYIRPDEDTMDFALMFIPSEAIYYDLLANKVGTTGTSSRDLIEYAFQDKKVIIVSPTSFMAYLQTIMQGMRSLQIEEQAKDIQKRVGQLGKHLNAYDTYMHKLGKSLGTTVNHFNTAHKELKKVDKDIVKIADTTPAVEPLLIDRPTEDD